MQNQIFNYNGTNITFQLGNGDVMVNLTEIAKAFPSKNLTQIINGAEIQEYMSKLSKLRNYSFADLLRVKKGAPHLGGGTWGHQKIVLRVVQKLSPEFAIWVDERIEELLKHGFTATEPTLENLADNPDLLIEIATKLKNERAEKEKLQQQNQLQSAELEKQAPKVKYVDEVLSSTSTYNTNHIAKELGLSAISLNRKLSEMKIQYKQGGVWLLFSKYQNKGYTKTKTASFTNSVGETKTSMQTVWTEKGRAFIHQEIKSNGR